MTTFKEFVKKWNAKLDADKSNYYDMYNGLTPHDSPCDTEMEGRLACELLYEYGDYNVLVDNVLMVDSDKGVTEREVIFEAEGNNYFMGIVETSDDYLVTKIYPVANIKEITAYEYTIQAENKIITVHS